MLTISKSKGTVLLGAIVIAGGAYMVASGATSGQFTPHSDGHDGGAHTIAITPSGGAGPSSMNLAFNRLLPGAPQTLVVNYQNTGTSAEDVYVVFPNTTALSALNSFGNYGAVHITSTGAGAVGVVFGSTNLSDKVACGTFSPSGCWPLRTQYAVAHTVAASAHGSFSFTFAFASAYATQPAAGSSGAWNPFPVAGQRTVVSSDGTGAGLPYEIVATQPGITPGQKGTITQTTPYGETIPTSRSASNFADQLNVVGASGAVRFVVTSPNVHLLVSSSGVVTTSGGPLTPGTYRVSGTDSDAFADTGTWTYALTVTTGNFRCENPRDHAVTSSRWRDFADQLSANGASGSVFFSISGGDARFHVANDGRITTVGAPPARGTYPLSGSCRDAGGDEGTWNYHVTIAN